MCTEYRAPTCNHSWISLTHPCGPYRNLLSCSCLETFQTLAAPAFTCPQCHGGFQNEETLRMISDGGWGGPTVVTHTGFQKGGYGGGYAMPGPFGGSGFLGGWGGGGGGMFPHFAGGGRGGAYGIGSPVTTTTTTVIPGGDTVGGVPVIGGVCDFVMDTPVMSSKTPWGRYGRISNGWFGGGRRSSNRRVRHERHSYSESAPVTGCVTM
jgi:hypothetical protein